LGAVVTLTMAPGTAGNTVTLASSDSHFTWSAVSATGSSGTTNGAASPPTYAFWGPAAELTAGAIANNLQTAINGNGTLGPLVTAAGAISGCTSNCTYTVTAKSYGAQYDYALATTYANTTYYWSCPPGGSGASAMCGGDLGVIWTYQSPSNGESSVQRAFGASGMVMETLDYAAWAANHAYAVKSGVTDSNGNNQLAIVGGTSGGSAPSWSMVPGGLTHDGTVTWMNIGEASEANVYLGTAGTGGQYAVKYAVHGLQ
jgi:hypothetical protein